MTVSSNPLNIVFNGCPSWDESRIPTPFFL
nr:MAG TPA: hypothetical protein [Caudoviricetes sp.]